MPQQIITGLRSLPRLVRVLVIVSLLVTGGLVYRFVTGKNTAAPTYQTASAARNNLVVTVTGFGSVAATNNVTVSTQATGVVTAVYAKDGDTVKAGQKLADLELDSLGRQSYLNASASLQSAKNSLAGAKATLDSLNSAMWSAHENLMSDAVSRSLTSEDPTYIQEHSDWLSAEAKYLNQLQAIKASATSLAASSLSYQERAPMIYAPISGRLSGFFLQPGTVIGATTSSSGSSLATKIASVVTDAKPTIVVSLTEIDITKVHASDKATITIDSQPGKTFTGQVVSVDTVGSVSSGVTSYPVTLRLDVDQDNLLPNMTATASIITAIADNVLTVPLSAVTTTSDGSSVQLLRDNQPVTVSVQTGLESDTEVEITFGLSEGDTVITATITSAATAANSSQQSVFSSFGRSGGARFVGH